MTRYYWRV